ncbi:hypothetical protein MKO06_02945 [Gramella sp. GC03-9]|uniref:DUF4412 domain-containing protein n=1 Tax=Christiangramia oceanisediminis TaxID=2920386 RepID=A0A9X2I7W2_9FLAO|nr:hypothetical protein [Gramella oceanisediminis]MCP9198847.1 hypothetical protein [Gramella oceanisediminis]
MKVSSLICFCLVMNAAFAQKLEGKWLMTKEGDTYTIPENLLMEIKTDSLKYYNFDELYTSFPVNIEKNRILMADNKVDLVEFVNEDRIRIRSEAETNGRDSLVVTEFVRLKETQTNLSPEEIQKLSFNFNWNDEKFRLIFNKELGNPRVMEIMGKKELTKIRLEKIDATYFVSIYRSGKRSSVFPIEKVTQDEMVLYGTPKKPYKMPGKKVE